MDDFPLKKETNESNLIPFWPYDWFLNLLIYSNIWVAMAIASLGIFTQRTLEFESNWQPIALIFAAALIPYNLDRIFDSYVQIIPDNKAQLFFRRPQVWGLLLAAISATIVLLYIAPSRVRYVSCAGIIPLLYGIPLLPWEGNSGLRWYRLKDIPGSKAWIVGSILTYAVIILPLAYAGAKFDSQVALVTLFMFVFIVTNSHTFDIRDLESDREKGVITVPIILGIKGTKILLATMNILMLLIIVGAWLTHTLAFHPEMIVAVGVNLGYVWAVSLNTPRLVYSIWIEACLSIPLLVDWAIAITTQ
ncbi:MAG: UbiA family prenyltransferase [Oscillatoriales cyanobacterium RM2_1_1]|nr:UbiA family prenyltransferase [Oscillatoriales cyanobacterium SM2_3_0]NJO45548.1 UbiA family prenyltransferase [Oscillatoriales cyanobacterium RM2_1_1]